ncbi:alkene reductase [Phaeovulum sp.]|uniref:alkene reductase n=1 Tax=Phaeovulum sp. TaxID=2934796 RepID=UPI003568451E
MTRPTLFSPVTIGAMALANRVVMAPLTRNRARAADDAPYALHAEYYAQRASAGLIITEGSQISPTAKGYAWTPGIYSQAQIEGWEKVTSAVHAAGGKIALQLWHVGRVSHTSLQPGGVAPVAPSAIAAGGRTFTGERFEATSEPRALTVSEIAGVVDDYATATRNARAAGFDGVEIHAANGYLIDQFLRDGANQRTDAYGGSIANRTRFLTEVLEAVTGAWEPGRVGIRLAPFTNSNGISDSDPMALFGHAISQIDRFGLAFLHMVEGQTGGSRELAPGHAIAPLRARFSGAYIANNGYDREMALAAVAEGRADLVAFGRAFIANPDLVERLRQDAPLNVPDVSTFYGGGAKGFTDYPVLADLPA